MTAPKAGLDAVLVSTLKVPRWRADADITLRLVGLTDILGNASLDTPLRWLDLFTLLRDRAAPDEHREREYLKVRLHTQPRHHP